MFTPVVLWNSYYIRSPPLFCGVRITYVYPRCFVEFILPKFTPVVLWSLYYIRLPPLCCGVRITYVYPCCFVEFVLHTLNPVVLWVKYYIPLPPLCCGVRITLSIVLCSVTSIIVFVVVFFFLLPLCASFELRPLIIRCVSLSFDRQLSISLPPHLWKKEIIIKLLLQSKISFHSGNNALNRLCPLILLILILRIKLFVWI